MRFNPIVFVVVLLAVVTGRASGQPLDLLVNHRMPLFGLDRYEGANGAYVGQLPVAPFLVGTFGFSQGPDANVYITEGDGTTIFRAHPVTGLLVGSAIHAPSDIRFNSLVVSSTGLIHVATIESATGGIRIDRYVAQTNEPLGTWVTASQAGLTSGFLRMAFGPTGDLFVTNGNTIRRFRGTDGASLGNFMVPGSGGLQTALDVLFAPGDRMLVSGVTGGANDRILQFDSNSGAFLGDFTAGTGLSMPYGMAIGSDGRLYVASTQGDRIDRLNLSNGSFIDTFVPLTAHPDPSFIGFIQVPEPSGLALIGSALCGAALWTRQRRKLRI